MQLGRLNRLPVLAVGEEGMVVGERDDFAVIPPHEVPEGAKRGDTVTVFVVRNDAGDLQATLRRPVAQAGEFAVLRIVDVSAHGAHADWGLGKDLLIPLNKMHTRLWVGDDAVVAVVLDDRGRCFGSTWLAQYLSHDPVGMERGRKVTFLAYARNPHGTLGVVDGRFAGMIAHDGPNDAPPYAEEVEAWVQRITPDGRLDCTRTPTGAAGIAAHADVVLAALDDAGGTLPLGDRSPPELIRSRLGMSKKAFKRAIGSLYKKGAIRITDDGITRA